MNIYIALQLKVLKYTYICDIILSIQMVESACPLGVIPRGMCLYWLIVTTKKSFSCNAYKKRIAAGGAEVFPLDLP